MERTVYKTKLGNDLFKGIIKRKKKIKSLIWHELFYKFSLCYTNYTADLMRKNALNQADNIVIFRSCLLPKMRLSVVLDIGYQYSIISVFLSAFAFKCYMSPSGLPILKHQLETFFAAENEKECGEGVTQCQQYIGDFFQFLLKYISWNISL